ncbi:MAG: O-antigen ligase family protein [Nitrospira sp.]|nr:O-antigen ligase family protein [Nitrospira sp.]
MSSTRQVSDNGQVLDSSIWRLNRLQTEARRTAGWTTTALGFTIPLWVVADSILVVLLVACWVAGGEWRERVHRMMTNPVALSVLLLFGWLLVGTLWGMGSLEERMLAVKKYADLLLIPLLVSMAISAQERRRAILALAASLIVTLVLSLALSGGFLPTGWFINCDSASPCAVQKPISCDQSNPCVFKKHTTHNLLMAFGVLLFGVFAWKSSRRWVRWGWAGAACLAASNVLLMVQGRTGYVVLAGLAMVAFHMYFGWRGIVAAIIALTVTFSAAYQVSSSFHDRVDLVATGVTQWNPQMATYDGVTERMELFYYTVEIIQSNPLIGVGTGGFAKAYAAHVQKTGLSVPTHPHNQYLLIMAQVGVVGLCLLFWLFVQQWRLTSPGGDATDGLLARGLVVTIAITCLFQPALNDHTEKLFYCLFSGLMFSGTDSQPETRA